MAFALQPWHWLIVVFLLLGAEALGAGGFLLGSAMAALVVSLWLWLAPELIWPLQLMIFGVGSLIFSVAYWKLFRKVNDKSDNPKLNNRASQLIGRTVALKEDLPAGQSKLQLGDTLWTVESAALVPKGRTVQVVGYQGMVLNVQERI